MVTSPKSLRVDARHDPARSRRWMARGGGHVARPERGSGSVLVLGGVGVLVVLLLAGLHLLSAVVAVHRARVAADLAALAGAVSLVSGVGDPCERAAAVARANSATARGCQVGPAGDVSVVAAVATTLPLPGLPSTASARARAGPAGDGPGSTPSRAPRREG